MSESNIPKHVQKRIEALREAGFEVLGIATGDTDPSKATLTEAYTSAADDLTIILRTLFGDQTIKVDGSGDSGSDDDNGGSDDDDAARPGSAERIRRTLLRGAIERSCPAFADAWMELWPNAPESVAEARAFTDWLVTWWTDQVVTTGGDPVLRDLFAAAAGGTADQGAAPQERSPKIDDLVGDWDVLPGAEAVQVADEWFPVAKNGVRTGKADDGEDLMLIERPAVCVPHGWANVPDRRDGSHANRLIVRDADVSAASVSDDI